MGKLEKWFWYLGCLYIGLSGCQGKPQGSVQFPADSDPSSYVQARSIRALAPPFSLAILPLDNLSPNVKLHWLGRSLSEMLTSDLAKSPSLTVIAREALGPVLREQWLQQRGFSSSVPAVDLGNIQGVHYLVRGGFHQHEDVLTINLQVVDVETGLVVSALTAQGPETEIPRLEQDLVIKILAIFDPAFNSGIPALSDQSEEESPQHGSLDPREKGSTLYTERPGSFGSHAAHQIDAHLSLEKITRHRMQAYQAAAAFWQEGWSTEIGRPNYHVWQSSKEPSETVPLLSIPIALFMQQNRIAEMLKKEGREGFPAFVNLKRDGLAREQADETSAGQLFFEKVRQPQRLFIRAINERGELIAVFSEWSWQTKTILRMSSPDRIVFPFWPQPFIRGLAKFPVLWVERGGQHVAFDAVMIPIPDERRDIVLEPVAFSDAGDQEGFGELTKDSRFFLPLKSWIQKNWNPPITEALPVAGYLPTNKRTVVALLHLVAGKIVKVQFSHPRYDVLFSRSLEELKAHLLGYCVSCQDSEMSSSGPGLQAIRLQLTLVKDLHGLRFGSPSR